MIYIYFLWRCDPTRVMGSSFLRFLEYTQRRTTVGRTPLDEWSARRRDLYLTTHNNHNRQTSLPPVGIEPTISAGDRPQTYALNRAATGTGDKWYLLTAVGLSLDSSTHLHINNTDNKTNTENNTVFISLCCAKVSQPDSYYLQIYPLSFCTRFQALTLPSLCGSQHTTSYSCIRLTNAILAKCFVLLFPFLSISIMKWSAFHAFHRV